MSVKRRGLGKGLNELLSATIKPIEEKEMQTMKSADQIKRTDPCAEDEHGRQMQLLPLADLSPGPYQPRQHIKHEGIEQLAESIRAQGVLQPILVKKGTQKPLEIVAGERRWRAAKLAGLTEIPCIVKALSSQTAMAIALIENIQREDLNPIEQAKALKRLADEMKLTHLQVAESVGKSRASVTHLLRLLVLNVDVQQHLEAGKIEMGHAKALLGVKGPLQSQMAATVISRGLSVRETERIVARLQITHQGESPKTGKPDPNIRRLEQDLADKLGAPVNIRHSSRKGQGTVLIRYNDVDELEGILAHFR